MFTVNGDVLNHMTRSAGNVHSEILMLCIHGAMFHCKRIPVPVFPDLV